MLLLKLKTNRARERGEFEIPALHGRWGPVTWHYRRRHGYGAVAERIEDAGARAKSLRV